MYTDLSKKLKEAFLQITLIVRFVNLNLLVTDYQWLAVKKNQKNKEY